MEADQKTQQAGDDLIITLFLAALTRPPEEREQFVREACESDPVLLANVLKRIEWEERMKGFLMTPVLTRERIDRPFAPGESVLRGRYRVLRIAGEGGMAVVYEAMDEKLDCHVALKCPRFEFRKRLAVEARKSLQVNHPNVCRVYGIHTEETHTGDIDFLSMEFIEGETLAARLNERPSRWLSTPDGLDITRQICAGLRAVHAAGIVHRDLKAGNVMLAKSRQGSVRAVIMDFGIAQDGDVFHSEMRGTPAYLAPELWMGRQATVQSDIYALGVLLHEMAFGKPPFSDDADWRRRLHEAPRVSDIGEPQRTALSRCLEPDPSNRFQSVEQFEAVMFRASRRKFFYAAAGVGACALAGVTLREMLWPASPVRLAVLPAIYGSASRGEAAPLVNGFLHDVSYRFKTLRHTRRPLTVYSVSQTSLVGLERATATGALAPTHAITIEVQGEAGRPTVSAALMETSGGTAVRRWRGMPDASLAEQLFAMQSKMVAETIAQLKLRGDASSPALPSAAYADYVQGMHFARVDYQNAYRAVPFFERVIQAAPQSALGYAGLAEAHFGTLYETGERALHGKAMTLLAKAEQLEPDSAHVHLVRGRLNHFMTLYERALADFQRAYELDRGDPQAALGIAWALAYIGRNQEADVAFQAAMAVQPLYFKPHLDAGVFYWEAGNAAAAERHWLESNRLDPKHTRAKLNLAILYLEADRLAESESLIRESLALRRTLPALELLGDLQDRQGKYVEAIATYEEALRTPPPEYKTWGALAAVLRKAGREAEALDRFRYGLADAEGRLTATPRDPDVLSWCAFYSAMLGDAVHARLRASEALAVAPAPIRRVRKRIILTYDLLRDWNEALRWMEDAPPQLLREIARSPSLSAELREDRRFAELVRRSKGRP